MSKYEGHTPWRYHELESTGPNASIDILDSRGYCICNIPEVTGYRDSKESLTIAKLIADAPMLAERVKELESDVMVIGGKWHDEQKKSAKLAEQNERMIKALKRISGQHHLLDATRIAREIINDIRIEEEA
jgi:hypothetical protein